MAQQPRLDTTRLQKIAQAYWESAALMAAVELEIFTAIAHGHDTVAGVARAAGISARNAERLLTALTAMTLLERDGGDGVMALRDGGEHLELDRRHEGGALPIGLRHLLQARGVESLRLFLRHWFPPVAGS